MLRSSDNHPTRAASRLHRLDCACDDCAPIGFNAIALRCLAGVAIALLAIEVFAALTGRPGAELIFGVGL